jgi:hypothetical protein
MKKETTKKGPITSNAELKKAWIKCWGSSRKRRFVLGLIEFLYI